MIDDDPQLDRRYRAPRAFGPMPGPRNIPFPERGGAPEVTTALAVSLDADPAGLAQLLPPYTRLSGTAVLTVTVSRFENLRWLAGRGYSVLSVTFPVEYVGDGEPVEGRFLAVLWEGLADPITTGREELGFPKLYADVHAPGIDDLSAVGAVGGHASWGGFRFLEVSAEGLRDAPPADWVVTTGTIVHRYLPSLVTPGEADLDQLVYHPPSTRAGTVTDRLSGTGRFGFHRARFADVPVQYTVINTLAGLGVSETGPATLTRITVPPSSAPGSVGPRLLGIAVPT